MSLFESEFFPYIQDSLSVDGQGLVFWTENIPQGEAFPAAFYTTKGSDYTYTQDGFGGVVKRTYDIYIEAEKAITVYQYQDALELLINGFQGILPTKTTYILSCFCSNFATDSAPTDDKGDNWLYWGIGTWEVTFRKQIPSF
jgi:hypothetical protein